MNDIVQIGIWQFALAYALLLVVGIVMKACGINQTKLLIVGSLRMTVQLMLSGFVLTYIFTAPHPALVLTYLFGMMGFSIHRVLSKNQWLNSHFKLIVGLSIGICGLFVIIFFVICVVGESLFNPQYTIPIAGMLMGNAMTGILLGLKTLREMLESQRLRINTMMCIGASPKNILLPLVRGSLETAMLPTINSMMGMGIVSLPGMMTGQILSGTSPTTAIIYQITIIIAITAVVCMSCFCSLYLGYKTLYHPKYQIIATICQ